MKAEVNEEGKRILTFEGIDDWNRPIFKDSIGNRFGDVDNLFDWGSTVEDVLSKISEKHICYFGDHFGCEPYGTLINPDKILLL